MDVANNTPNLSIFVGQWVALSTRSGAVSGVGDDAAQTLQLARHNRPKEQFTLKFILPDGLDAIVPSHLHAILAAQRQPVYLVGGAVRDFLTQRAAHDLDFVVAEGAIKLAFRVGNALGAPAYALDKSRDIGRVIWRDSWLDFAKIRGNSIEADLMGRDFTLNAMALQIGAAQAEAVFIDPAGGLADLRAKKLVPVTPESITADAVRALRGVWQAVKFEFTITVETAQILRASTTLLGSVSAERVRDVLLKMVMLPRADEAFRLLSDLSLLPPTMPKLADLIGLAQSAPHHEPVWAHTLRVLKWVVRVEAMLAASHFDKLSDGQSDEVDDQLGLQTLFAPYREKLVAHLGRDITGGIGGRHLLRLAALYHDCGKAQTGNVDENGGIHFYGHDKVGAEITLQQLTALRLSNEAAKHTSAIVDGHMRPLGWINANKPPTRRALFRFCRQYRSAALDIVLLALADHLATYKGVGSEADWAHLISAGKRVFTLYFEEVSAEAKPPPLVQGGKLMKALGLKPGPTIGQLLRQIEEARILGEIENEAAAIQFARMKIEQGTNKNDDDNRTPLR